MLGGAIAADAVTLVQYPRGAEPSYWLDASLVPRAIALVPRLIARANVDPELITNEQHLVPAALEGDRWALSVIERAARPLAQVLSVLTASLGLDCIVVVGGFAQRLGKTYKEALCTHMSELLSARAFAAVAEDLVRVWNDGEETCLAGAAAFYQMRRAVS